MVTFGFLRVNEDNLVSHLISLGKCQWLPNSDYKGRKEFSNDNSCFTKLAGVNRNILKRVSESLLELVGGDEDKHIFTLLPPFSSQFSL